MRLLAVYFTLSFLSLPSGAVAQEARPDDAGAPNPELNLPKIPDEPRTIDPAKHVPQSVARAGTVEFEESSLREIAQWLQENLELPVLFDNGALSQAGIAVGESVSDRLADEPVYLFLNRLSSLGLSWYVEDNILHLTTSEATEDRISTVPYNLSDLLDAGYRQQDLLDTVESATAGPWMNVEGSGGEINWLGDVVFIHQTDRMHREVSGLFAALRRHARQTLTLDPPRHHALREALDAPVDVQFNDTPLVRAVEQLAEQTETDIRLDRRGLRESRIRDREPVTLTLAGRNLATVLRVLLTDLNLTWILRDGVLWITSRDVAEGFFKTAVYDVRDLCRNDDEAGELGEAIQSQTSVAWMDHDGDGGTISFARSGTMVVRHTETGLRQVADLLEAYRTALLASRRRDQDDPANEVITRYYRTHAGIADDLAELIPRLVRPQTWRSVAGDAPGTIMKVSSSPEILASTAAPTKAAKSGTAAAGDRVLVDRAVLIVRQTRAAHEEIAQVLRRVEQGDAPMAFGADQGGGGFGGGFFSVPGNSKGRPREK